MKKPKKLNLYEMWDLYVLVGDGEEKEYMIDEVYSILDRIPRFNFIQIMQLLYRGFLAQNYNPVEIVLLLVKGLKKNQLFLFSDFIKGLTNGRTK